MSGSNVSFTVSREKGTKQGRWGTEEGIVREGDEREVGKEGET